MTTEHLRIGELSRRTGVSPELLRAWERRYELFHPERSAGGLRLYTREDLERVRLMQRHLAAGLAAAEAARLAVEIRADTDRAGTTVFDAMAARAELGAALEHFDEPAAQAVFDRVLAVATLDSHDIGLVAFGLALHARGWRIHFLGADTPIQSIADAARSLSPDLVVLAASRSDTLDGVSAELEELGLRHRVAVGGAGVRAFRAPEHVLVLGDGPVAAAEHASALF